jgi:hypothetical protein
VCCAPCCCAAAGLWTAWTYQLIGLLQRPFCSADGCLARLAGRLLDLLDLLRQVGLHQLQLGFVAAKALGAGFCVDEVGHGCGVGKNCKIVCVFWWCDLSVRWYGYERR